MRFLTVFLFLLPVIWFSWKLLIVFSIFLCCFAFYRLHYQPDYSNFSYYRPRSLGSCHRFDFTGPPRISFLFLVRKDLPLDFLWSSFFELKNSIQVEWGEATMIAAERLLFAAALKDPANQRFVLLSDSCVPLYNFIYTYSYLMASPKSFVDSFVDTKEERYNPKMSPLIGKNNWRKGSQLVGESERLRMKKLEELSLNDIMQMEDWLVRRFENLNSVARKSGKCYLCDAPGVDIAKSSPLNMRNLELALRRRSQF